MSIESLATISFCEQRRHDDPLFQIALTSMETKVLDHALQWWPDIRPAPRSGRSHNSPQPEPQRQAVYYETEWVIPDGDGWAPWSEDDEVARRPIYARAVLAVPDGDGWAPCDEEADEEAHNGYWLDSRQLSQLVAHFAATPVQGVQHHTHAEAGSIKRCAEMLAHAMDRGMHVHVAYQRQIAL